MGEPRSRRQCIRLAQRTGVKHHERVERVEWWVGWESFLLRQKARALRSVPRCGTFRPPTGGLSRALRFPASQNQEKNNSPIKGHYYFPWWVGWESNPEPWR